MDELVNRVFSLPPELILNCAWDAKTLVILQLAAISRRDQSRFLLLDQQWKKMGFKPRDALRELVNYEGNPTVDQLIDRLLKPYTLQRQIRELFEGGMAVRGYLLFKTFSERGDIVDYILGKYFPSIFRARVELKEWDLVIQHLGLPETIWQAFEVYRTLNHEQQQELRSQLDDEKNLFAEFLIDSEGTEVDDWTDELIDSWINPDTLQDAILSRVPAYYRRDFVRNLLYYSHGDERYDVEVFHWIYSPYFPREEPLRSRPLETFEIMARFRGSEKDFEALFLQRVKESAAEDGIDISANDGEEILRLYDEFDLERVTNIPFHQYPALVRKYGKFIRFHDRALDADDFEMIFDLIDRQDNLQALRDSIGEGRYGGSSPAYFALNYYGVQL
jgi:hypothetical protein